MSFPKYGDKDSGSWLPWRWERVSAASRSIWISSRPVSGGETMVMMMQLHRSFLPAPSQQTGLQRAQGVGSVAGAKLCAEINVLLFALAAGLAPSCKTSFSYSPSEPDHFPQVPGETRSQRKGILLWLPQTPLNFPSLCTACYATRVQTLSIYLSEAKCFSLSRVTCFHKMNIHVQSVFHVDVSSARRNWKAIQGQGANISRQIIQVGFPHISTTAERDWFFSCILKAECLGVFFLLCRNMKGVI